MITANDISNIKGQQLFKDLKVRRIGNGVYSIIGFSYGEEERKMVGYPEEVAKWLNGYFGYSE